MAFRIADVMMWPVGAPGAIRAAARPRSEPPARKPPANKDVASAGRALVRLEGAPPETP
jgi:hypothetical protein